MEHLLFLFRCPAHYNRVMDRLARMMRKYLTGKEMIHTLLFETFKMASNAFFSSYEEHLPDEMLVDDSYKICALDLAIMQLNFFLHFQLDKRINDHVDVEPEFFCDKMFLAYYKNGKLIDFNLVLFEESLQILDLHTDN